MNEALKVLSNIRSLRALLRDVSYDTVREMSDKLIQITDERRELEAERIKEEQAKAEKLKAVLELMGEDNITVEDLAKFAPSGEGVKQGRTNRPSRPGRYKYIDSSGQEKTWTGQGRKPLPIQKALDNGGSLDEFLNPDLEQ